MKRLLIALSIFFCFCLQASKNQELFLQANNAYLKHDLDKALSLYEQITDKGPAIWFNMGNVQFEKENFLLALIYYKRAKKGAMLQTLQDIEKNVTKIQEKLQITEKKNWVEKLSSSLFELGSLLPLLPVQLMCLLLAFLLAFSIIIWRKKHLNILFGIIFLCSLIILYLKYRSTSHIRGIIMAKSEVYVGPRKEFHTVANITPGSEVVIAKRNDDWYKIKANGLSGWVTADTITIL